MSQLLEGTAVKRNVLAKFVSYLFTHNMHAELQNSELFLRFGAVHHLRIYLYNTAGLGQFKQEWFVEKTSM